ncbi:hypothetical protein KP509_11G027300 [Ceratopteris richardii]|uniref:PPPDE domain-containing protein n=1 Tax=Ceratopteris richardii TaxID=49495 RepID=A0A8T2TSX3_CERRI|nr:hypothetical protein KP509_11G027300 [Ceratopteris richardii]
MVQARLGDFLCRHTGIVAYGNEYYFGGGIQSCPEGQTPYGKPLKAVELGGTQIPKEVFEDYLQEIRPRYTEQTYSLLKHNCNNFCEEVAQFLLGVGIPDHILKLPEVVMNSPMGALIMPMIQQFETILKYGGVPQVPHVVGESEVPTQIDKAVNDSVVASQSSKAEDRQLLQRTSENSSVTASGSQVPFPSTSVPQQVQQVKAPEKTTDELNEARARVQEEITREFAALMAQGQLRASEAAALAARKVIERHGRSRLAPRN